MSAESARFERSYTDALERLAGIAESSGDFAEAARLRQKLVDTDPVSSKHATGLIRALMNAGDHAAALRHAERYEAIVAQELGTSVGPGVAALVAEVRERSKTDTVVVRGAAPPKSRPVAPVAPQADEQAANTERPITPVVEAPRRHTRAYAIAAIALAVVFVSAWFLKPRSGDRPSPPANASSIAVLPLTNLSGDSRDAALADGISEELIGVLAKIERLRVVARTSAFGFRNSNIDVRRIADSLHVANILEGSVQKVGGRIRVQVRLVDASDGSTRWSETYDRDLREIFEVQSDIASEVARELDLRLGSGTAAALRRRTTQNIAAYELYLRGADPALLRSDSAANLALQYFKQAVALDSTYAAAHAGIARMYLRLRQSDFPWSSARSNYELARKASLKAVALDDSLAEAHATLGLVRMVAFDFAGAERELKRAIAIDPGHSRIREWLSFIYYLTDRPGNAMIEANRAVENDPLSPSAHAEVGRALCANGRVAEGLARLNTLRTVQPPLGRLGLYTALCHTMNKDWAAAAAALPQGGVAGREHNSADALLAYSLARSGRRREALAILDGFQNQWSRKKDGAHLIAVIYAGLGNRDRSFEWLNRAVDDASLNSQLANWHLFDDLRGDPRYADFERRVGIQKR